MDARLQSRAYPSEDRGGRQHGRGPGIQVASVLIMFEFDDLPIPDFRRHSLAQSWIGVPAAFGCLSGSLVEPLIGAGVAGLLFRAAALLDAPNKARAKRFPWNNMGRNRARRPRVSAPFGRDLIQFSGRVRSSARPSPRPTNKLFCFALPHAASDFASGGFASPAGGAFTTPVVWLTMTFFQMLSFGTIFTSPSSVRM